MTRITKHALVLFLIAGLATARQDLEVCGTHPLTPQQQMALHRGSVRRLAGAIAKSRAAGVATAARDIRNIAVLEDTDGIVTSPNDFNLNRKLVRFTPAIGTTSYRFEVADSGYDAAAAESGTPVSGIGDDDFRTLSLPFSFPFYGKSYTQAFLQSDGNVTFASSDVSTSDRSLGRMTAGPARIAPLFRDLDPTFASNGVRVLSQPTRWVVTWLAVPEYQSAGFGARQTFQLRLYADGKIEFAYESITSFTAVVGIAPGNLQGASSVVSFAVGSTLQYTGAMVERFSSLQEIDLVFAAQKFFETHDDAYDYLVFYNNMGLNALPGAVAYEVTVRSDRIGIGDTLTDDGREYGSVRRLQAVLNLGPLSQYPRDPYAVVPARATSRDTPLSILGHESGHLWLALASVREPGNPTARPMLGRQGAHWSFTFNSEASLLEGNRIRDNGAGVFPRFATIATTEGYAPLDQYLMGFRPPEEVPPTFLVTDPTTGPSNRAPQSGVSFDGGRRDISIDQVIEVEGRRIPDHTVAQRKFRSAFILVTAAGRQPTEDEIAQLEAYQQQFELYFDRITNGRASVETSLRRRLQLSVSPAAGVLVGQSAAATLSLARPAESPLTVLLRTQTGAASVPASVTIAAGQTQVTVPIRGERVGVEELSAEPSDNRYATAYARIQVSAGPEALSLAIISGDKQAAVSGSPLPQPLILRIVDRNNLPYPGIKVSAAVTPGGAVSASVAVSDADGYARFQWTPGAGQLHELRATIAGNPQSSTLVTALGRPTLEAGWVVNSASFAPGLTPGGLATLFGLNLAAGATAAGRLPLPTEVSGVRVMVAGRAAQLLYVSDRQINIQAPSDLATGEVDVQVSIGNAATAETTAPVRVPVRAVDPGIFSQAGTGLGAILIAGTGKTTVERAARADDVLEIYCTGLGAFRPSSSFTVPAETVVRPQVTIAGRAAELLYSGQAPGFPGLYQVNVRVPAGIPPGSQPLVMRGDAVQSNEVRVFAGP